MRDLRLPPRCSLFWNVTQCTVVVIDVSGQPINVDEIFAGTEALSHAQYTSMGYCADVLTINKYESPPYKIIRHGAKATGFQCQCIHYDSVVSTVMNVKFV